MKKINLILLALISSITVFSQANKIESTGYVGIGTTSPVSLLHIRGTDRIVRFEGTGEDPRIGLYTSGGVERVNIQWYQDLNSGYRGALSFNTHGSDGLKPRMYINSYGQVGIGTGTSSLTSSLHVTGSTERLIRLTGNENGDDASSGISLNVGEAERAFIKWHKSGSSSYMGGLSFGTHGSDGLNTRIFINGQGEVGIGTTDFSGDHKLRVEGSIGAREIKVEASGWSDFVFDNNYKLRTLEEVEQHIKEKGHLPEIPSEVEVTENGINLGEMNAKLLQKIEELTLYLIEQNKQNQVSQERITKLEKELSALKNK